MTAVPHSIPDTVLPPTTRRAIPRSAEMVLLVAATMLLSLNLLAVVPFWFGAPSQYMPLVVPVMAWSPTLVMWLVHALSDSPDRFWTLVALRSRRRGGGLLYLVAATIVLLAVAVVPTVVNAAGGWQAFAPTTGAWAVLGMLPVAVLVMAVQVCGEEFGWRGYAQTVLRPLGFWPATVIIGGFWTVWHLPLLTTYIQLGEMDARTVAATVGNLLLASVVLSALRWRSGTVWPAVLAHMLMNTLLVYVQSNLIAPATGLSNEAFWISTIVGWTVWGLCAAALVGGVAPANRPGDDTAGSVRLGID